MSKVRGRRARLVSAAIAAAALLPAAGCGGGDERTSSLRPPSPINVAVQIGQERVSTSPPKIGAGPVVIIASNQTNASHRLTIDGPRLRQSVGPINPRDTAQLEVTVRPGTYTLSADGSAGIKPATLQVGPKRPSSQNELLQP